MNVISLKSIAYRFSTDYGLITIKNIVNIHEYLIERHYNEN